MKEKKDYFPENNLAEKTKISRRKLLGGILFAAGTGELGITRWQDHKLQQQADQQAENIEIDVPDTPSVPDTYRDTQKEKFKTAIYNDLAQENQIDKKVMLAGILWGGAAVTFATERVSDWLKKVDKPSLNLYQEPAEPNDSQTN